MKLAGFLLPVTLASLSAVPALAQEVPPVSSHLAGPGAGLAGPVQRFTWSGDVVRIFQNRCQGCHHDGGIAPFPLMTYRDAWSHRSAIGLAVLSKEMPPWRVRSTCVAYTNDLSLTDPESRAVLSWVANGAPEGDPKTLPPPLTFPDGWQLGEPDAVLSTGEPFTPDFSQGDVYRCFVVPSNFTEDRFLSAFEVRPGNPTLVHHVLAFLDTKKEGAALDAAEAGPGYTCFSGPRTSDQTPIAGWVPGQRPIRLADGLGAFVPKGADLILQVHYSARGGPAQPDVTSVGLHFATPPVTKRVVWSGMANYDFVLKAGDPASRVQSSSLVTTPLTLLGVQPHMHLLGRTMQVNATLPDGRTMCIVDVYDWDRRWQDAYLLKDPVALPVGTRLDLLAVYDNSSDNPNNPNLPPQDVRWGDRTTDEMCVVFFFVIPEDENLAANPGRAAVRPRVFETIPREDGPAAPPAPRRERP